jgi:predicted NUDIX family phosphoesterase
MAKDYKGEQILVITRELFDSLGSFQGINTDVDNYLPTILDPKNNFFMDRGAAEDDQTHKQLIPYVLIRLNGQFVHYSRGKAGGEARLHAKRSMGIGGHINPEDKREDHLGYETYMAGVEREIAEEVVIDGIYTQKIVGLLNDDSNEVGKVHLGVVHLFDIDGTDVKSNEDAIADLKLSSIDELKGEYREQLETWSQYCADILNEV